MRALFALGLALLGAPALAAPPAGDVRASETARLAREAGAAAEAGRYGDAGALFLEAYAVGEVPAHLRRGAEAFEAAERFDDAEAAWARYSVLEGLTPEDRAAAKAALQSLAERRAAERDRRDAKRRAKMEALEAKSERASERPEQAEIVERAVAEARDDAPRLWPSIGLGVGAASVIASVALFVHSDRRLSDLDQDLSSTDASGRIIGIDRQDAQGELDGINAERNASAVLLGVGLAVGAASALWWWLAEPEAPGQIEIAPGGAAFSW